MTALADIKAEIAARQASRRAVPLIGRRKVMVVEIGWVASLAIRAETTDHRMPGEIDGLPVVPTSEFHGWSVIER